ncbi:MAG: M18 family aminopeptidase [Planctomycetes bacterium]|nr:M18 family aminopeptidase [Planctomycetota bacterium]
MNSTQRKEIADLAAFIDASPSPSHACAEVARRLAGHGFQRLEESLPWPKEPGRFFTLRGGSLIAWVAPEGLAKDAGFRLIGAHTDSPNLRIKPRPDRQRVGIDQLGVEVYGGVLLNSWLDRDLGLSGRVWLDHGNAPEERLFLFSRPLLRVPQLAIHLHRDIHTDGLKLNKQTQMVPIFSMGGGADNWRTFLAKELEVAPGQILHWDAMVHDLTPSTVAGAHEEFFFAPRLDNLCSVWAGLRALERVVVREGELHVTPMLACFDHEEVGSESRAGAQGTYLRDMVERVVASRGGDRDGYHRAVAQSFCVSSDMAHATHPNYADLHDPEHLVRLNAGVVIKMNANQRYASEGLSVALFEMACKHAGVAYQKWVMRSDLACGSTIGPISASGLGVTTVDVGGPMLSMHSAREMCGSHDPAAMVASFEVVLAGDI